MSTLTKILLAIGGIYAVNLIIKATSAKALNFSLSNVGFAQNGLNANLNAIITIQNPTSSQYTVQSLVGNFFVNDQMTGTVSSFVTETIPAHAEINYPVNISLQPGAVISDLIALFNNPKTLNARLVGNANAENLLIPFDITYTLI
jgi:hypothetical protein